MNIRLLWSNLWTIARSRYRHIESFFDTVDLWKLLTFE